MLHGIGPAIGIDVVGDVIGDFFRFGMSIAHSNGDTRVCKHLSIVEPIPKAHRFFGSVAIIFQDGLNAFGFIGIFEHDVDGEFIPTGGFANAKMGKEKRFLKFIAEGDHLINDSVIMVGEVTGLREAGPIFFMGRDDAVINHIDMAFVFFDEGQAEAEALSKQNHAINDFGWDGIFIDDIPVDDGVSPIHRDHAIGFDEI